MKQRRFAYICSPQRGSKYFSENQLRSYCKAVERMGYIPISPWLMFPFLSEFGTADTQTMKEYSRSLIRRFNVFIVTGPFRAQMREENKLAKDLRKHRTTLDGMMVLEQYERQQYSDLGDIDEQ